MDKKIFFVFFATLLAVGHGTQPSNYDLSRQNKVGTTGFNLRDIWNYLIGGGYGNYYPGNYQNNYPSGPGLYPSGPGYPGNYPGSNYPGSNYPGANYPTNPGVVGPPGAHPGCPLCDSSVYSYCSHKQAHDACCCENPAYLPYNCRKSDCKFLYANSCQEFQLISGCCCVDLQKNSIEPVAPLVAG